MQLVQSAVTAERLGMGYGHYYGMTTKCQGLSSSVFLPQSFHFLGLLRVSLAQYTQYTTI
jgi:hypothetical protein